MKYRRNDNAGLPVMALVAIVVVVALVLVVVAWPYFTRAADFANDPDDPPDEVEDPADPPDWQGKFEMEIYLSMTSSILTGDASVGQVVIVDSKMTLENYDGQPWSTASLWGAILNPGAEKYKASYALVITKGSTTYGDMRDFWVYKDDNYEAIGKSGWFFFWEEQEGNWQYELEITCQGKVAHATGTLGLSDGKALVN